LANTVRGVEKMYLRGPDGFEFHDDCTSRVVVETNFVFGVRNGINFVFALAEWHKLSIVSPQLYTRILPAITTRILPALSGYYYVSN
jgi:hypothetical protein